MDARAALHYRIVYRKKEASRTGSIAAAWSEIGAVAVLNDVLLPAMKEVGDKFGAGELILPFVLHRPR